MPCGAYPPSIALAAVIAIVEDVGEVNLAGGPVDGLRVNGVIPVSMQLRAGNGENHAVHSANAQDSATSSSAEHGPTGRRGPIHMSDVGPRAAHAPGEDAESHLCWANRLHAGLGGIRCHGLTV